MTRGILIAAVALLIPIAVVQQPAAAAPPLDGGVYTWPTAPRASAWSHPSCGCDNGRAVSGDIYAGSAGAESWSSSVDGLSNTSGANIGRKPSSTNVLIWWDGDPTRELLDQTRIDIYVR